ncbi:uncharacterized protein BDV14DRAFT_199652 [Aspergillus stella-maris]|uniref:uncharacterized protein n=1 Tax=Aspergillus stella-maris TaxID=1810926 RepID=UPI003CCDC07B
MQVLQNGRRSPAGDAGSGLEPTLLLDLEAARITRLPGDAFYIPDFISEVEEEYLLRKITSAPQPTWKTLSRRRLQTYPSPLTKSNTLLDAPLPSWLSDPILPRFAQLSLFENAPHEKPNHVLVNEYQRRQGIMPHEDGGAYYPLVATVSLGDVIVLDLYDKNEQNHNQNKENNNSNNAEQGSKHDDKEEEGDSNPRQPKPTHRILQERRSLLITRGALYSDFLHGIAEVERDEGLDEDEICNWGLLRDPELFAGGYNERGTRMSLTYRDVLKVSKVGGAMKFLNKK